MQRLLSLLVRLVVVSVALAGCGSAAPSAEAPTTVPRPAPVPLPGAPTPGPQGIRWTGPFSIELSNGWTVRDCEGERTNVCVWDGDVLLGDIELLAGYPLDEIDDATDPVSVATAWATDMVEHFRDDRRMGCEGFTFEGHEVVQVTVGGLDGARSGFTLEDRAGRIVEQVVNYYVVDGGAMAIINVDAYAVEEGCLGPSEYDPSFVPEDLQELAPHLDALVGGADGVSQASQDG